MPLGRQLDRARNALRRMGAGLSLKMESVWDRQHTDLFLAHLAIYRFSSSFCPAKRVLDAGCGTGYGSAHLAKGGAATVHGVDKHRKSIRYARRTYGLPNLRYSCHDLQELPDSLGVFDVVLASNALEHLEKPSVFLARLSMILTETGSCIFAVPPIVDATSLRSNQENPFHNSNLYLEEWAQLFRSFSLEGPLYRQAFTGRASDISFTSPRPSSLPLDAFTFDEATLQQLYQDPGLGTVFVLHRQED